CRRALYPLTPRASRSFGAWVSSLRGLAGLRTCRFRHLNNFTLGQTVSPTHGFGRVRFGRCAGEFTKLRYDVGDTSRIDFRVDGLFLLPLLLPLLLLLLLGWG